MIQIDTASTVPLAEQIEAEVRRAIASNAIAPGDFLPPVRQLAADLGVNLNTVARAYRALEASGLIITRRGRGTIVTASLERGASGKPDDATIDDIARGLEKALSNARLAGLKKRDVTKIFDRLLRKYWQGRKA